MAKLLSPKQVNDAYGIDRNTLISWEDDGLITASRTPGGHRRYNGIDVETVANDQNITAESDAPELVSYSEFGKTGMERSGGQILEERLKELRGHSGRILKREMRMNDPVLGAMFFGISTAMRKANWRVVPASDNSVDRQTGEFVDEALHDMTWDFDTQMAMIIDEMLEQGFSMTETVFKKRLGEDPEPYIPDPATSLHTDGKIGWRKWAIRPATSLDNGNEWIIDDNDGIQGINQVIDNSWDKKWRTRKIPIEKLLHFRTTPHPANNPEGQALPLDTPIPTPRGYVPINDLKAGDIIYGKDGKFRYVTWKSPVWEDRPVYKIKFTSKHQIVADENHLWEITTTKSRRENEKPKILTTKEVFDFFHNKDLSKFYRAGMCVGVIPVLDGFEQETPIDPYILGYWLGDGSHGSGSIACHKDDYPNLKKQAELAGFEVSKHKNRSCNINGLSRKIRAMGLYKNKHVPQMYMRANAEQRLALLQGFMDADGTIGQKNDPVCRFANTNKSMFDQMCELVRSLGNRVRYKEVGYIGKKCGKINGKRIIQRKRTYDASFYAKFPVFRLPRKLERQSIKDSIRTRGLFIQSIEPHDIMDTVCIEVDDPDHIFLAGEGHVPTHNSIHRAAYVSWYRKMNLEEIEGIGIERDLAGIPVVYLGKGTSKSGPRSDFALAQDLVVNLRNDDQIGVVFPHQKLDNDGNGILLELLSSDSRRSHDTDKIISRYNSLIAMSTLVQFLFMGVSNVGSYAAIKWQGDLFSLAISAYLDSIAGVINKYAIPKLVRFNGINVKNGYPKLTPGVVGIPDLDSFGKFVNGMVSAKVITVNDEFENRVRQVAGLPQMSADIMGKERETMQLPMFGNGGGNGGDDTEEEVEELKKLIK